MFEFNLSLMLQAFLVWLYSVWCFVCRIICYCRQHTGKHCTVYKLVSKRADGVPGMPGMERERVPSSGYRRQSWKPTQRLRICSLSCKISDDVTYWVRSGCFNDERADCRWPVCSVRVYRVSRGCMSLQWKRRCKKSRFKVRRNSHRCWSFATSTVPNVTAQISIAACA